MKKYRLKEEVKKYFSSSMYGLLERGKAYWIADGISIEALEEVEERVELILNERTPHLNNVIYKASGLNFTEQEREDIEKFLNVFGSFDNVYKYITETMMKIALSKMLKEKGYDK
jgi:hypothetical protein